MSTIPTLGAFYLEDLLAKRGPAATKRLPASSASPKQVSNVCSAQKRHTGSALLHGTSWDPTQFLGLGALQDTSRRIKSLAQLGTPIEQLQVKLAGRRQFEGRGRGEVKLVSCELAQSSEAVVAYLANWFVVRIKV